MALIFETKDFLVETPDVKPHHSRSNGGHVKVSPKIDIDHRQELPLDIAAGLMHLTIVAGEAVTNVMRANGIDVVRINYQDNGNWAHRPDRNKKNHLHVHLYVRSNGEKHPDNDERFRAFPDALVFPGPDTNYYDNFEPLTEKDCHDIKQEILRLLETDKYKSAAFNYGV